MRLARRLGFDDYAALAALLGRGAGAVLAGASIEDMGLEFSRPWDAVVDTSRGPEWATWFVGGRLNIALELRPPLGARRPRPRSRRGLAGRGRRRGAR